MQSLGGALLEAQVNQIISDCLKLEHMLELIEKPVEAPELMASPANRREER